MNNELRHEIATTEERLIGLKSRLDQIERSCQHKWDKVKYDPIFHPGYQIQGDPPGTMGIDRQGPMWVNAETIKQWSRMCTNCGKIETTQHTRKEKTAGTIPGTSGEIEVPNFGDARQSTADTGPHWSDKTDWNDKTGW
jgi:hypothetical protein